VRTIQLYRWSTPKELLVRVNRIAYREYTRDPALDEREFRRRLGVDIFGANATAQASDDLLFLRTAGSAGLTGSPLLRY
jgi:hypothetical protein